MSRLAQQMSFEQKKKFADFVVDTSGSKEETTRQVNQVMQSLRTRGQVNRS